jgi:hypothetical protein
VWPQLFICQGSLSVSTFLRNTTTEFYILLFVNMFWVEKQTLRKPLLHSATALLFASTSVRMTKRNAAEVYKARSRATFTSQIGGVMGRDGHFGEV